MSKLNVNKLNNIQQWHIKHNATVIRKTTSFGIIEASCGQNKMYILFPTLV